jgi:hypothetical protein
MAEMMTVAERQDHWRGVMEQWRQSGLKRAAFCRERGVTVWQLRYWHRRLAGEAPSSCGVFAPVRSVGGSGLRLRLGGLELEVEPGFDEATMKRLLRALGAAC